MSVHLKLTIKVTYDEATVDDISDLISALYYAADHLASQGLLSTEEAVVDMWAAEVEHVAGYAEATS